MKSTRLRTCLILLFGGSGWLASGALRPEGDKIEFSPPREVLKVAPMTGTGLEGPDFNFKRRESGGSLSDVPAAIPLPAPDRVNRMRALEEMIEKRNAWARPEGSSSEFDVAIDLMPEGSSTEMTIDDLYERRDRGLDRGENRFGDSEGFDGSSQRDDGFDRSSRDGMGLEARDARSRALNRDRDIDRDLARSRDSQSDDPTSDRELNAVDSASDRRGDDRMGPTGDPLARDRRGGAGDGLFDFGSLVPNASGMLRDPTRSAPTREDRLDSLRRVLGTSASTVMGPAGAKSATSDILGGAGILGTMGAVPGANRTLSQTLDARPGGNSVVPAVETPSASERLTSAPNRPFGLDLTTGREGYGTRSERLTLAPPAPTPMEMFRRKHEARIPTRDF